MPAASRNEIAVPSGSALMICLKSILAGVLAIVVAAVGIVGIFALIARTMGGEVHTGVALSWRTGTTAAMIFALGFAWEFRRATRQPATRNKATGSASTQRG